jgi:uncharacterized membrane protein YgdD (TMEM256/DUF423 family)
MSEFRAFRILIILAGLMGADGVILAAVAAHRADATQLSPASSMLLFHATAVLAVVALSERGIVNPGGGIAADLSLRHFSGHSLFPLAAPTSGTLLIASWVLLAVAAAWPRRN